MATTDKKSFTEKEKVVLASLIREHGSCIENKKTDGCSIQEKRRTWETITGLYNMQPESNCSRSSKQLRKLWDNMKQKKRKEVSADKRCRLLTGGGPKETPLTDPVNQLIDVVAPHMDVDIECPWDSTSNYESRHIIQVQDRTAAEPPAFVACEVLMGESAAAVIPATIQPVSASTPHKTSSSTSIASSRKWKRAIPNIEDERYWRVLKAKEAVLHQQELHQKRMEAANAEAELALLKLNKFKRDNL